MERQRVQSTCVCCPVVSPCYVCFVRKTEGSKYLCVLPSSIPMLCVYVCCVRKTEGSKCLCVLPSLPKDQDCHELWCKKYKKMQRQDVQQQEAGKGSNQAGGVRVPLKPPDKGAGEKAASAEVKPAVKKPLLETVDQPVDSVVSSGSTGVGVGVGGSGMGGPVPPDPTVKAGGSSVAVEEGKGVGEEAVEEPPAEAVANVQAQLSQVIALMQAQKNLSVLQIAQSLNVSMDNKTAALLDQFRHQVAAPAADAGEDTGSEAADLAFVALGSGVGEGHQMDKHAGVKAALAQMLSSTTEEERVGVDGNCPPSPAQYRDGRRSSVSDAAVNPPVPPPVSQPHRISGHLEDTGPAFAAGHQAFAVSEDSHSSFSSLENPPRDPPHFYDRDRDFPVRRVGLSPRDYADRPPYLPDRPPLHSDRAPVVHDYSDRSMPGPPRGGQGYRSDHFHGAEGRGDGYRGPVGMGGDGYDSYHGGPSESFPAHGMHDRGPLYRGRGGEGPGGFRGGGSGSYGW